MATPSDPASNPGPGDEHAIGELIRRAARLKHELVDYGEGREFRRQIDAAFQASGLRHGHLDEARATLVLDYFVLQHQLPNGRTVVERFVAQRRPRLSDADRAMMLGWRDVIEGIFEVNGFDGEAVELRNLTDDLDYRVYSNLGREAFRTIDPGTFLICRIVPLSPTSGVWLVSGNMARFPESHASTLARTAVKQVMAEPTLLSRNPRLWRRAWEMQAAHRAEFIAQTGADMVVVSGGDVEAVYREHYRRLRDKALRDLADKGGTEHEAAEPHYEGQLPDEVVEAESVAIIYDEVDGLNFYVGFGRLDAFFAEAAATGEATDDPVALDQLDSYLRDDSVEPLAIRRLVGRHPGGADPVFRALLAKPGFMWSRDGEQLLRRYKPAHFDREPAPAISVLGSRLAELSRAAR